MIIKKYLPIATFIYLSLTLSSCEEEEKKVESDFSADKTSVITNEIIQFTDLSRNNPENWRWEFGDETTSVEQNPQHSYKFSGNYTVNLNATKGVLGDSESKENYITVNIESGSLKDIRDNTIYKTVKIGNQWWMSENLNYNCEGSSAYRNNVENADIYGRLYYFHTALEACPDGWHLPSKMEWEELTTYAGDEPGKVLKSTSQLWDASSNNFEVTNGTGFSALPGGGYTALYLNINQWAFFWTSDLESNIYPLYFSLNYWGNQYNISYYADNTDYLKYYIRCVKD